ncbi:MAG: sigma-70 family RNA polymerase sigma factor [Verrucomicrobia bacterium]|nr:sigma-70 family RNA polymerase sigma factor [Verrucomicrobiota bacterium]
MQSEGFDVQACLAQVRQGDQEAACRLLSHLHPLVLKLVRAHRPRRTGEEDLVQTVFMKVFAKLGQYRGQVPLEHWVSRVAVNTCLSQLQHERIRPELRLADLTEDEEDVVQNLAASAEELPSDQGLAARELVAKLLLRLDAKDRLVVTLLHLEGRSVREVSEATGWSPAVVKVRAFRARRRLRGYLNLLMDEESL